MNYLIKKIKCLCVFLLSLIVSVHIILAGENNKHRLNEEDIIPNIETIISDLMDKASIPGLSMAIIKDGGVFWNKGFGVKSLITHEPVTDSTVFVAASLSKLVFAYAAMKMVQNGELNLDTPLIDYASQSYIEEKYLHTSMDDDRFKKITARMVLSHTSGLPNWRHGKDLTLLFEPGSNWSYSGEGFVFLQCIIEKISGKSFNEFVSEYVFKPLGMTSSSYLWQEKYKTRIANSHTPFGFVNEIVKRDSENSAASLYTTSTDYAKFINAIINDTGLKNNLLMEMIAPQFTIYKSDSSGTFSWGLGLAIYYFKGHYVFFHHGDDFNYKCFAIGSKDNKMGVVYFTNSENGLVIVEDLIKHIIGEKAAGFIPIMAQQYDKVIYYPQKMKFIKIAINKGIDAAIDFFNEQKVSYSSTEILGSDENLLVNYSKQLLEDEKIAESIQILKLNTTVFPKSSNSFNGLGDAYFKINNRDLAIQSYKKVLELNPNNKEATNMIEKLTKE